MQLSRLYRKNVSMYLLIIIAACDLEVGQYSKLNE